MQWWSLLFLQVEDEKVESASCPQGEHMSIFAFHTISDKELCLAVVLNLQGVRGCLLLPHELWYVCAVIRIKGEGLKVYEGKWKKICSSHVSWFEK